MPDTPRPRCWLCRDLGGLAVQDEWTQRRRDVRPDAPALITPHAPESASHHVWRCPACVRMEPEPTGDLRERLAEAITEATFIGHPSARPTALHANRHVADAVLPVVEDETAALRERAEDAEDRLRKATNAYTRLHAEATGTGTTADRWRERAVQAERHLAAARVDRRELDALRRDMGAVQAERDDYHDAAETALEDARLIRRDRDILATRLEQAERERDEAREQLATTIWIDPERQGGQPCIGGTRIPVQAIIGLLDDGEDAVLATYPTLTREQVAVARWYRDRSPGADTWTVAVQVPMSLPAEMRDSLAVAVADAVSAWEPDDRDGWDADVSGSPTPDDRQRAEAAVQRVQAFAEQMRTWCSPHGVAADYAKRLLEVLDQSEEAFDGR